ncbi:COG1361 family protein [Thermococcus henrietii]|uniref:hypothetical protein n=1 Tax=Thermococcus henrietii TaxID=2016361 RepID=UPI000C08962F|nr:hypothetical protein [Thermococcus henrietii]
MRRLSSAVILLMLLALIPPSSASSSQAIQVIAGDYAVGTFTVSNPTDASYKLAVVRDIWVEDSSGKRVEGFNVTVSPHIVQGWGPREEKTFSYNVSCSPNVPAGSYYLKIRFLVSLSTGGLSAFTASVPLTVLSTPLRFGEVHAYTPSGTWPLVFMGEGFVVYSTVHNLGHKTVKGTAYLTVLHDGKPYVHLSKGVVFGPGTTSVSFEVKTPYSLPPGHYVFNYTIRTPRGTFSRTKAFTLSWGVSLLGVSLERSSVYTGDKVVAYVSVLSQRNVRANLSVKFYLNGKPVYSLTKPLSLDQGTLVFNVPLFTKKPGQYRVSVSLLVAGKIVGTASSEYRVIAPPKISSVVPARSEKLLEFRVLLSNPGPATSGLLSYVVRLENGTTYSGSRVVDIPPGNSTVDFSFPSGEVGVTYSFNLSTDGHVSSVSGTLAPPVQTTTTTSTNSPTSTETLETTSTSSSPSNSTALSSSGGNGWWPALVILLIVLVAVGAYYTHWNSGGKKRRGKRGPKRRSPLGRFKRPKPPKFHERDSLPKKK